MKKTKKQSLNVRKARIRPVPEDALVYIAGGPVDGEQTGGG